MVDFLESHAAAPATTNMKIVAVVGVESYWPTRQPDVKQPYIRADLHLEVCMKVPKGCGDKNGIVRLDK